MLIRFYVYSGTCNYNRHYLCSYLIDLWHIHIFNITYTNYGNWWKSDQWPGCMWDMSVKMHRCWVNTRLWMLVIHSYCVWHHKPKWLHFRKRYSARTSQFRYKYQTNCHQANTGWTKANRRYKIPSALISVFVASCERRTKQVTFVGFQ